MDTALVLPVAEADAVVARWRDRHDPSAAEGMPAHITVLYPFKDAAEVDGACMDSLREMFGACKTPSVVLSQIERFPGVLWLSPQPAEPIREMTRRVVARYPECRPYGGIHNTITPHLTVAIGDDDLLDHVAGELLDTMDGPIVSRLDRCVLYEKAAGGWHEKNRFYLATRAE